MEKVDGSARARSCWRRSRAMSTTSARTWSTSSSPTTATRSTTSGSRSRYRRFLDKAKEVEADAIGMSGLLVKSTLIMRENLQEMNSLGLAEVPVILGGAALAPRNYVEHDLRGPLRRPRVLRQGRVRGPAHHGHPDGGQAQRHPRPRLRARPRRADLPPRKSEREAAGGGDDEAPVVTRSDVATDVPISRRRSWARAREGHHARGDRRLHQRDRPVPQPVAVPARQERCPHRDRRRVQGTHPAPAPARSWPRRNRRGGSSPRSRGATSRSTPTATT